MLLRPLSHHDTTRVDGYGSSLSSSTDYFSGAAMVFNVLTGARTALLTPTLTGVANIDVGLCFLYLGFCS
jgi:hypothetical protein